MWTAAAGLLAGVIGNIAVGVSQALQKYGVERANKIQQSRVRDPIWLFAMFLHFAGEICGNLVALATTSPAVVAPLGSLALICNAFLSSHLLNEPLHANKMSGGALIVFGVVMLLLAAPEAPSVTLDEAMSRVQDPLFVCYFGVAFALAAYMLWSTSSRRRSDVREHAFVIGIMSSFSLLGTKIVTGIASWPTLSDLSGVVQLLPICAIVGILLCVVELLKQRALSLFESSQFFPLVFAAYNFFVVCSSLVFYRVAADAWPAVAACLAGGLVCVYRGIVLFSVTPELPLPVSLLSKRMAAGQKPAGVRAWVQGAIDSARSALSGSTPVQQKP